MRCDCVNCRESWGPIVGFILLTICVCLMAEGIATKLDNMDSRLKALESAKAQP